MRAAIVHLSDIHYRCNWGENHEVVFSAFFLDLKKQLELLRGMDKYLVISGDVVNAGNDNDSYDEFISKFDAMLTSLNIPKNQRICVPGNHDVSTEKIQSHIVDHEGVVSFGLNETKFNDYSENPADVFKSKFDGYRAFENQFTGFTALNESSIGGSGREIANNIGVYCLNSAFFSSGGLKNENGRRIEDKGRLSINTRNLHAWVRKFTAPCKILVLHHPLDWLTEWAQQEIQILLKKEFAVCLSGHAHNQAVFHSINKERTIVQVSAPPLFTAKSENLGYSIVTFTEDNTVAEIIYRQWTKYQSFVPGVNFSNTEDGKVRIGFEAAQTASTQTRVRNNTDSIDDYL